MIAEKTEKLPVDSDLTPFSFCRAHDLLVALYWRTPSDADVFDPHLVVSKTEDLKVVHVLHEMYSLSFRSLPVTFADIPEYSWILFGLAGEIAVYSVGA